MNNLNNIPSYSEKDRDEAIKKDLKHTADRWKWRFNLPQKPNYANVYFYKKSKKLFNAPCYDLEKDKPPDSYKGEHFSIKKILEQTESRLKYAKTEADKKQLDLTLQWKHLEIKEKELRNSFIAFNGFLSKNMAKRIRAEQKYKETKREITERNLAIKLMKKETERMKNNLETMSGTVEAFKIYENFLHQVVDTGNFRNIQSVINRYLLLEETKKNVAREVFKSSEAFYEKRQKYMSNLENFRLFFLSFSNELSELRKKYDEARTKTSNWEIILKDICNRYAKLAEDISWSKMALRHMFEVAFYRTTERLEQKKEDIDRMLRINDTLKALERIEEKLSRLHGHEDMVTSLAPEASSDIEIREIPESSMMILGKVPTRKESFMSKWFARRSKAISLAAHQSQAHQADLAGFLKLQADEDMPVEEVPIKLSASKWTLSKVRDFPERYRKALLAIQEEELQERMAAFTYTEPRTTMSQVSLLDKPHKSKWAVAAIAQKIIEGGSVGVQVSSTSTMPTVPSGYSDSALTLLEDGEDDAPFAVDTESISRRTRMKKIIEKKFATLVESSAYREISDKEREKAQQTLPPILTPTQLKEKESCHVYTKKQEAMMYTHRAPSVKKSLSLLGVKKAIKLTEDRSQLPPIDEKDNRKQRRDIDAGKRKS